MPPLVLQARAARSVLRIIFRRVPFSAAMILAILVTTAITNTLSRPISTVMLEHWGFGIDQIRDGHFYQLFLAPFQILRPYMAITIAGIILLFLGVCEYQLGTRRAMVTFLVGHVVGYVGGAGLFSMLERLGSVWGAEAARISDVGASNGAFGAAGTAIVFLEGRPRKITFVLLSVFLVSSLILERRVWDVEHVLAFSAGIGVGRFFLWRMGRTWPGLVPRWQLERRQRPLFVSWALAVIGAVNILGAFLLPHHAGFSRLESLLPVGGVHWPRHLLLVTGIVLITLAPGLAKRQRPAWWGALCALVLSLFLQAHVGITKLEGGLAGAFLVLLVAWRRDFLAPTHTPSLRSGVRLLVSLVVAVPCYGLLGFFILRSRFSPPVTAESALVETLSRVAFSDPGTIAAVGKPAEWFLGSIPVVTWFGVVYALTRIVRSALAPEVSSVDLDVARELVRAHGTNSTSYMSLWKGNTLFFGPARDSFVAYRVNAGVAIALGDPIGPRESCAETIRAFDTYAEEQGWTPTFYATRGSLLGEYHRAGYEALQIGEEAVIRLQGLEFRGKDWQSVRSAFNRAKREGVVFRMFEGGEIPAAIREQLVEIEADWSSHHELPAMGFTLGTIEDVDDPDVNVAVAMEESGRVHAYVDWLPVHARRGWVIDLMRRRDGAMSGVMDFVIGMSLLALKERGYEMASLATAPLADLDRDESSSWIPWILGKVYEHSHTYYDFRSLFRYKDKFRPDWESIYLVHRGLATLPTVAAALLHAYLPDLNLVRATRLLGESAAHRLFAKDSPQE